MTEPWQWLGLDVRGPLPQTAGGHRYILSVTDFFSKWVEAVAMESCLPSLVAQHLADVIGHFGYPVRILSRLPHDSVHQVRASGTSRRSPAIRQKLTGSGGVVQHAACWSNRVSPVSIVSLLQINSKLKQQLKISVALVVHHQQTGAADVTTQQLINRSAFTQCLCVLSAK